MYDDIWKQITQLYRDDEIEATYDYNLLKYIAISQVPTPFYPEKQSKFSLKKVTHFEKSLEQATDCFKRLTFSSSHSEKTKIIMDTLQTLTDYSEFPDADIEDVTIDADTLIGLMVLVVCRSQVKNLKSHLFYLQNFSLDENTIKSVSYTHLDVYKRQSEYRPINQSQQPIYGGQLSQVQQHSASLHLNNAGIHNQPNKPNYGMLGQQVHQQQQHVHQQQFPFNTDVNRSNSSDILGNLQSLQQQVDALQTQYNRRP